jgi:formamidopyrimidine-DNA glycosylase
MPELPEVTTTAKKLDEILPALKIKSVWTNYNSSYFKGKENIKDPKYFKYFKKEIEDQKIESVIRVGKNVLINISGPKTILIHMKMTGHLLYGKYKRAKIEEMSNGKLKKVLGWVPDQRGPLQDKFNQYIRLVFELSNGNFLVLSDARRFAKVCLIPDADIKNYKDLKDLGIDPILDNLDFKKFKEILMKKPDGRIKNILIDQELIAGIGNIYSDEALWLTGIHPEQKPKKIKDKKIKELLKNIKVVLKKGINFGGDSTSDYRQPDGTPGNFQKHHMVYRRKGEKCLEPSCNGKIIRKVVGGRSAHFCDTHQKLIK